MRIAKKQLRRIIREALTEGGGIAMSPAELAAHGESVWTPDMEGYHPLIDGESTTNGVTRQALHGGWAVEDYQAEIEDIMTNNLDNPHMELAYNIVFKDAAPGYLPFNFFNKLTKEFESLGASKELMGHFFHVMVSDDFEINPPGW